MRRHEFVCICAVCVTASTAAASDWTEQISRATELPAHRWLEKQRRLPTTRLSEFSTDGCSGGMSSLWSYVASEYPEFAEAHGGLPPWEHCCVLHDQAYHGAGTDPTAAASYDARLAADMALEDCVAATAVERDEILETEYGLSPVQVRATYARISSAMFIAVRLGGAPCTGLPWRWGYGYPQCWQPQDQ